MGNGRCSRGGGFNVTSYTVSFGIKGMGRVEVSWYKNKTTEIRIQKFKGKNYQKLPDIDINNVMK